MGEGGRCGVSHNVDFCTEGDVNGRLIGCVIIVLGGDVIDVVGGIDCGCSGFSMCSGMVVRQAMASVLPNPLSPLSVEGSSFVVTVIFGWRIGANIGCPMRYPREIVIGLGERLCIMAWISPR